MKEQDTPDMVLRTRVQTLLTVLGIESNSFFRLVEWVLSERLVRELASQLPDTPSFFREPDALKKFRNILYQRRKWSKHDYEALFRRVQDETSIHYREPIPLEEVLLLRLELPLECAECHRKPPDVRLHIDHVIPASKGGASRRENLQFLCAEHNLRKSDKRRVTEPWLDLQ